MESNVGLNYPLGLKWSAPTDAPRRPTAQRRGGLPEHPTPPHSRGVAPSTPPHPIAGGGSRPHAPRPADHLRPRGFLANRPTLDSIGPTAYIFRKIWTKKKFYETRCSHAPPAYEIIASSILVS